jgi:Cof subfamily protein (haloacid dehalogenase superfamily)
MRYRLLAIDLDGTLLGPDGRVSDANRDALAAAQAAGAIVVPCTGRAWHESHWAIDNVPGLDRGVFVTGGLINDMATGRTLEAVSFDEPIARQLVDLLADAADAVLVFRDRDRVGHDYLVTGRGQLTQNTAWWFEHSGAKVAHEPDAADLSHTVRIAMVSHNGALPALHQRVLDELPGRVNAHRFAGIARQEQNETVEILEVFPAGVDKWRGIRAVAAWHGIARDQIATIGDEINDVPMLREAGLGVAMGNAAESAAAVADRRTLPNASDGVAHAIGQMLADKW